MERKIIFATGNENKMVEIRMILADLGMPILSMKEAGLDVEITLISGADKVTAAVLSGDVHIGFCGSEATIYVYNQGEEVASATVNVYQSEDIEEGVLNV